MKKNEKKKVNLADESVNFDKIYTGSQVRSKERGSKCLPAGY